MPILLLGFPQGTFDAETLEQIRALAGDLDVIETNDRAEIERRVEDIEIAAGDFPTQLLGRASSLKWLQQWGAGVDWLLRYPEAVDLPFVLTNASGVHTIQISEHIIAMLLMFARDLHRATRAQVRHEWWRADSSKVFELPGKTMLLVGVGAIGERTAELATALGMRVEGIRSNPDKAAAGVSAMYGSDQLLERLPHADVVVLTVPLSKATKNMIGERELAAMKRNALIINIGRGGTIDEPALVRALEAGQIAGAGLDVFAEEPLPPSSPLWDMEQVIISAHYAGATPHYHARAQAIFLDNLKRYRAGEPMRNVVDKDAGY